MEVAEDLPRWFWLCAETGVDGSRSVQFGGFLARATGALKLRSPTEDFEIRYISCSEPFQHKRSSPLRFELQ